MCVNAKPSFTFICLPCRGACAAAASRALSGSGAREPFARRARVGLDADPAAEAHGEVALSLGVL